MRIKRELIFIKILNIKKILIIISAITLIFSCSKDKPIVEQQKDISDVVNYKKSTSSNAAPSNKYANFLSTSSPSAKLDSVAKWHNAYQSYVFDAMVASKFNVGDTVGCKNFLFSKTDGYFLPKGLDQRDFNIPNRLNYIDTTLQIYPTNYSQKGYDIMLRMKSDLAYSNLNGFNQRFYDTLNKLKAEALALPSATEQMTVGGPISTAIASSQFWTSYGDYYFNTISQNFTLSKAVRKTTGGIDNFVKNPSQTVVNKGQLLYSDVAGAISGAEGGGIVAGPGGVVAGVILGGAVASSYDLCHQIIGHMTGWW